MGDFKKMPDSNEDEIPDKNIFMICRSLNHNALCKLSSTYHLRNCRKDELDIWKDMPFDDPLEAIEYRSFMNDFFASVYANEGDLFFDKCLFVCDNNDMPIATGFMWKAYGEFSTLHSIKVVNGYKNQGIGRALLSIIIKVLKKKDYPVYLHTQPASDRAIKLYSARCPTRKRTTSTYSRCLL